MRLASILSKEENEMLKKQIAASGEFGCENNYSYLVYMKECGI